MQSGCRAKHCAAYLREKVANHGHSEDLLKMPEGDEWTPITNIDATATTRALPAEFPSALGREEIERYFDCIHLPLKLREVAGRHLDMCLIEQDAHLDLLIA